jgi:hypothetical protein
VKEIQFPDLLRDFTFVSRISRHFPSLVKATLNLPSILVVRAFAAEMKKLESFKELDIKIRYDFSSLLNSMFLTKMPPLGNEELENIRILKNYSYSEQYVIENNIELPIIKEDDDIEMVEDISKFVGLEELVKQLSYFELIYIPRILRLPSGSHHWNEDECEFSQTLIGFKEYPMSQDVYDKLPAWVKIEGFVRV